MGSGSFSVVPLQTVLNTETPPLTKKGKARYAVVAAPGINQQLAEKFASYYFKPGTPIDIYLYNSRSVKKMRKYKYGEDLGMRTIPRKFAEEKRYVWIDSIAIRDSANGKEIEINGYTPDREGMDII